MRGVQRLIAAGFVAAALMIAPSGLSLNAYAHTLDTQSEKLASIISTAPGGWDIARVKSNGTGNSELDKLCSQVADLINNAQAEADRYTKEGNKAEAKEWQDLANELLRRANSEMGCSIARPAPARFTPAINNSAVFSH